MGNKKLLGAEVISPLLVEICHSYIFYAYLCGSVFWKVWKKIGGSFANEWFQNLEVIQFQAIEKIMDSNH